MTTIDELQAKLDQARADEWAKAEEATRQAHVRETAYRRQRLAQHDPRARMEDVQTSHRAFLQALEADPVWSAFAEARAAHWRQHRAHQEAHNDRVHLATVEGHTPPHDSGTSAPPETTVQTFFAAVMSMVEGRVLAHGEQVDAELSDAVTGDLTPGQAQAVEAEAEEERRREAAKVTMTGSIDVTGMSDADREAHGLPPGSSRDKPATHLRLG